MKSFILLIENYFQMNFIFFSPIIFSSNDSIKEPSRFSVHESPCFFSHILSFFSFIYNICCSCIVTHYRTVRFFFSFFLPILIQLLHIKKNLFLLLSLHHKKRKEGLRIKENKYTHRRTSLYIHNFT